MYKLIKGKRGNRDKSKLGTQNRLSTRTPKSGAGRSSGGFRIKTEAGALIRETRPVLATTACQDGLTGIMATTNVPMLGACFVWTTHLSLNNQRKEKQAASMMFDSFVSILFPIWWFIQLIFISISPHNDTQVHLKSKAT